MANVESAQQYKLIEGISFFLFAVGPLNLNAVLVMLESIANDFGVNHTAVLIAIPAFMIPFAILQLFTGGLSDVKGRVPVIIFGLLIFACGMFIAAISSSIEIFALAGVLGGIGFAFVNPVLIALVTDIIPPSEIPRKMGLVSAVANISSGLGPLIAGQIVAFSWRYFYILFLVITLIGLPVMIFTQHPPLPTLSQTGLRMLASSYSEELRRPIVILMMLSSFMIFLPYSGLLVWTSTALTGIYEPVIISVLLLLAGIVAFTIGISMGRIIRKIGIARTIIIGLSTLIIGVIILLLAGDITTSNSIALIAIALPIAGIAGGSLNTVVTIYSQRISPTRRGVLAGLVTAAQFMGASIVPIVYDPFFNIGISMVYLVILFAAIILSVLLISLQKFASKIIENKI
jgi:MFS family permease